MDQKIEVPLTPDVEIILKGHKVPYYLDKEVFAFAIAMQNILDSHKEAKGDSWKAMTQKDILYRVREEVNEVGGVIYSGGLHTPEIREALAREYVDVAIFCMFGATLTQRWITYLKEKENGNAESKS